MKKSESTAPFFHFRDKDRLQKWIGDWEYMDEYGERKARTRCFVCDQRSWYCAGESQGKVTSGFWYFVAHLFGSTALLFIFFDRLGYTKCGITTYGMFSWIYISGFGGIY